MNICPTTLANAAASEHELDYCLAPQRHPFVRGRPAQGKDGLFLFAEKIGVSGGGVVVLSHQLSIMTSVPAGGQCSVGCMWAILTAAELFRRQTRTC